MPLLPTFLPSVLGPIPVLSKDNLMSTQSALGESDYIAREMSIQSGLHPDTAWQTFWHESFHFMLWDSGLSNMVTNKKLQEALCDSFGSFMVQLMKAGFIQVEEGKKVED